MKTATYGAGCYRPQRLRITASGIVAEYTESSAMSKYTDDHHHDNMVIPAFARLSVNVTAIVPKISTKLVIKTVTY